MPTLPPAFLAALRVFAQAVFSTDAGPPPDARLDWLLRELTDFLGHAGPRARFIVRLALFAVWWGAPLFVGAWPTLGRLAPARRIEALTRMEESFASAPILAVKAFLCVTWYEHPDAMAEVGYVGFGSAARSAPGSAA